MLKSDRGYTTAYFDDKSLLYNVTLEGKTYLGFAEMKPGYFGHYRFTRIAHSFSSLFYANYEELAGKRGFLLIGRNPNPGATLLTVRSGGNTIDLDITSEEVVSCFLPQGPGDLSVVFYGLDGRDLTPVIAERYPDLQPRGTAMVGSGIETPLYHYCLILIGGAALALLVVGSRKF